MGPERRSRVLTEEVKKIVAYAGSGDDHIYIGPDVVADIEIHGGAGNDTINAGGGNNVIEAGDGKNSVTTGSGSDRIVEVVVLDSRWEGIAQVSEILAEAGTFVAPGVPLVVFEDRDRLEIEAAISQASASCPGVTGLKPMCTPPKTAIMSIG